MQIQYMTHITNQELDKYISTLINKTYSVLPLYEEKCDETYLQNKVDGLIRQTDGFLILYNTTSNKDTMCTLDILSYLYKLRKFDTYADVKACVFKVCRLLSTLKVGG